MLIPGWLQAAAVPELQPPIMWMTSGPERQTMTIHNIIIVYSILTASEDDLKTSTIIYYSECVIIY
jgi:hypothetical protein